MPRPGPRPYECIRRAWHSDSHQPLRGGLIQEIFRVVNELHGTSTRRKKEWQEKLPIVVLRAEEILYSKANSESEYLDVESLRNRLQDAVNTMIRREDSDESGPYLPPCVEAALSLGCPPKKTPRGHRQGYSRLPPRRSTSSSPNAGNVSAPAAGKGNARPSTVGTIQEAGSSPTFCPLGPQVLTRQDQGHRSILIPTASSIFSPIATSMVSTCYSSDANPMPLTRNIFPSVPEVSHSLFGPSFPELGSSDILRAPDTRIPPGFQVPGKLDPFSRMLSTFHLEAMPGPSMSQVLSNFHPEARAVPSASQVLSNSPQEARAAPSMSQVLSNFHQTSRSVHCVEPIRRPGGRADLGLFNFKPTSSLCTSSAVSMPISTISNMSRVFRTDGYAESVQQAGQKYGGVAVPGKDSVRCKTLEDSNVLSVGARLHLPLQMHATAPDNGHSCVFPKTGSSSPRQQISAVTEETACSLIKPPLCRNHSTLISADTGNTACSMDVHDLQLRLGPPPKESTSSHASSMSEQPPLKSWQLTEEGPSNTSTCNDGENSLTSAGNNHTQFLPCKKHADVCDNMPVIAVDTPASKRLRSDTLNIDCCSPPCENMMQLGSGFTPSMTFVWPRW